MGLINGLTQGLVQGLNNGLNDGVNSGVFNGLTSEPSMGSIPMQPETLTWIANLPNPTNGIIIPAVNEFIFNCKRHNNFLFDRFYVFAQNDRTNAMVSISNPTTTKPTEVNTVTFTPMKGFNGNGTDSYIDSQVDLTTMTNCKFNNGIIGVFVNSNDGGLDMSEFGNGNNIGNNIYLYSRYTDGNAYAALASTNTSSVRYLPTTFGNIHILRNNRYGNNSIYIVKNGSIGNQGVVTTNGFHTTTLKILCRELLATRLAFSTRVVSFCYIGSGEINPITFNKDIQILAKRLGLNFS